MVYCRVILARIEAVILVAMNGIGGGDLMGPPPKASCLSFLGGEDIGVGEVVSAFAVGQCSNIHQDYWPTAKG